MERASEIERKTVSVNRASPFALPVCVCLSVSLSRSLSLSYFHVTKSCTKKNLKKHLTALAFPPQPAPTKALRRLTVNLPDFALSIQKKGEPSQSKRTDPIRNPSLHRIHPSVVAGDAAQHSGEYMAAASAATAILLYRFFYCSRKPPPLWQRSTTGEGAAAAARGYNFGRTF